MKVSWTELKSFLTLNPKASIQYVDLDNKYYIKTSDQRFDLEHEMFKDVSDTTDLDDFEDNYKVNSVVEVRFSAIVGAGLEEAETYTPASGKRVTVIIFRGDAAFSKNSVCRLAWMYNTVNEVTLWTEKGAGSFSEKITIPIGEINGTNSLAVVCENGEAGDVYLSAYARFEVS